MTTETAQRHARFAVSVIFLANGALFANVVPRLPAIRAELDLSNSALGAALAASPAGALFSGLVAGALVARIGSGRLAVACAVAYGAVLALVGVAPSWAALAGALLLLGALDSVMDVAMNAHGLRVQRRYGRSIINGFHAWWSIGAALGGLAGATAAAANVSVTIHLATVGVVLATVTIAVARWLLPGPDEPLPAAAPPSGGAAPGAALSLLVRALGLLGILTLLAAMVEDVPASWSAVYLRDGLGAGAGTAGMGYVAFAVAMTAGRLVNDRLVERLGEVTVARAGAAAAAVGLGTGLAVGTAPAAVAGLAVAGFGASSLYPALFHAAGSRPGVRSGDGIAFVSWVGRFGFLLGPPLVGLVADAYGLQRGLFVAVVAATLVALFADVLAPPSRSTITRESPGMMRRFAKSRALLRVLRESRRPDALGIRERLRAVPRMSLAVLTRRYRALPVSRFGLYVLAALYVVWPLDIVPEAVLLGLGLIDDVGVTAWLVGSLLVETDRFLTWERERSRVVPGEVVRDDDRR